MLDSLRALWDSLTDNAITQRFAQYLQYMKEKIYEFKLLPRTLRDYEQRGAYVARVNAERNGSYGPDIDRVRGDIASLFDSWETTDSRLEAVLPQLQSANLAGLPFVVAAAVAAVAIGISFLIAKVKETGMLLDAVERRVLTPEEMARIKGAGGIGGLLGTPVLPMVVAAAALYFVLPQLLKKGR